MVRFLKLLLLVLACGAVVGAAAIAPRASSPAEAERLGQVYGRALLPAALLVAFVLSLLLGAYGERRAPADARQAPRSRARSALWLALALLALVAVGRLVGELLPRDTSPAPAPRVQLGTRAQEVPGSPGYWSWRDERGTVHLVDGWDKVPSDRR